MGRSLLYGCLASKQKVQGAVILGLLYPKCSSDRWCVCVIIHALTIYQNFYANMIDITLPATSVCMCKLMSLGNWAHRMHSANGWESITRATSISNACLPVQRGQPYGHRQFAMAHTCFSDHQQISLGGSQVWCPGRPPDVSSRVATLPCDLSQMHLMLPT